MSILQDIYDSEINLRISTFWDGGYDLVLGDDANGIVDVGVVDRWGDVEPWFRVKVIEHFPGSVFAMIYRDGMSRHQAERAMRDKCADDAGRRALAEGRGT